MKKLKVNNNMITVSLAEICNIKCKFCYHCEKLYDIDGKNRFLEKKERKFMPFDVYKRIFDNFDIPFDEIDLTGYGEPTLNPDFFKIMEYTLENNKNNEKIKRIFISTNAVVLDKSKIDRLLFLFQKYDIKAQILFSINAHCSKTYIDVCGVDAFEKVQQNAEYFIKRSNELKLTHRIFSTVQMVIINENKEDVIPFVKYWEDFFNKNNFKFEIERACACGETIVCEKTPHTIALVVAILGNQKSSTDIFEQTLDKAGLSMLASEKKDTTRLNSDHLDIKDFNSRKPCSALWKNPIITTEGDLCICSRDLLGNYSYGNVEDNPFSSIYYSDYANKIKSEHIMGNFHTPDICFDCQGFEATPISENEIFEFLNEYSNPDIFYFYKNRMENGFLYHYSNIIVKNLKKLQEFLIKTDNGFLCVKHCINETNSNIDVYSYEDKTDKKNIHIKHNTFLPCSFLLDNIEICDKDILCGCNKNKISYFENIEAIKKMLKGDFSDLPDTCINCYQKKLPDKHSFLKNKNLLNDLWSEFYLENEFFERNLPDFNITEFNSDFLNTKASKFRESYIRFILKYDKDLSTLKELYKILENCNDAYIYAILLRGFLYNLDLDLSFELINKIVNIYPMDYFVKIQKYLSEIRKNNSLSVELTFDKFEMIENDLKLLWVVERYCNIKDIWKRNEI